MYVPQCIISPLLDSKQDVAYVHPVYDWREPPNKRSRKLATIASGSLWQQLQVVHNGKLNPLRCCTTKCHKSNCIGGKIYIQHSCQNYQINFLFSLYICFVFFQKGIEVFAFNTLPIQNALNKYYNFNVPS